MRDGPYISVVICTMPGRLAYLERCLESLAGARGIGAEEVLLVTRRGDDLPELTSAFDSVLPLRMAHSEGEGVADKRNVGARAARGEIVAYVDDDAVVDAEYITSLREAFSGGAACVVGAVEPIFESELPGDLGPVVFRIGGFNRFAGRERRDIRISANCAFRKSVLESLGPFDTRIGPGGSHLPWGEDTDMFRRLAGEKEIVFSGALTVRHHIQPDRATRRYVLRRAFLGGRTLCFLDRLHQADFWRRAAVIPILWVRAWLLAALSPRDLDARVAAHRLTGYLAEMAILAGRGMPSP